LIVSQFLDLCGASGAVYRFRRARPDQLPATAGNFALVRRDIRQVVCCGAVRSLGDAASAWLRLVNEEQLADSLYIRLNVARNTRLYEHSDLVAALRPQATLGEPD
jgi:hypothetical protein